MSGKTIQHRPIYLLYAAIGIGITCLIGTVVDGDQTSDVEEAIFHAINSAPSFLYWPLWPVMQLGNLFALPAAALVLLFWRRWRAALGLLGSTVAKIYLARAIKDLFVRGRPAAIIGDVTMRGDVSASGQAFVSGHAIVIFALATIVSPYLSRRWKIVVWVIAVIACIARIYVGAHLPLDVIGGATAGWAVGSLANFLLGNSLDRPKGADHAESSGSGRDHANSND